MYRYGVVRYLEKYTTGLKTGTGTIQEERVINSDCVLKKWEDDGILNKYFIYEKFNCDIKKVAFRKWQLFIPVLLVIWGFGFWVKTGEPGKTRRKRPIRGTGSHLTEGENQPLIS